MKVKDLLGNSKVSEGVFGTDYREPAKYPAGRFDYDAWKKGKGPKKVEPEEDRNKKHDPKRFFDKNGELKKD